MVWRWLLSLLAASVAEAERPRERQQCLNATDFGFTEKRALRRSAYGGERFALTIASGAWDTSDLAANLIKILSEDLLGIETNVMNHLTFSSDFSLQAVAGLEMQEPIPANATFKYLPAAQLSMDVWETSSTSTRSFLKARSQLGRVISAGDAGYAPQVAMHTFRLVVEKAWEEKGLALDFYKTYISDIDSVMEYYSTTSQLLAVMSNFNIQPGCLSDQIPIRAIGYETLGSGNERLYHCEPDGFWYPPACREGGNASGAVIPDKCVPFLFGGYWPFQSIQVCQLVERTGTPMAISWVQIPEQMTLVFAQPVHQSVFAYWWSDHFRWYQEIRPVHIRFDKNDPIAWLAGDVTTDVGTTRVVKYMWAKLQDSEDQVAALAQNYRVYMSQMRDMMMDVTRCMGNPPDMTKALPCRWEAACNWLRSESGMQEWTTWMPKESDCSPGMMWNGTACVICEAGTFKTTRGPQACTPCPDGTFSRVEGNRLGCTECEAGTAATAVNGTPTTTCTLCELDSFQDEPGQAQCQKCPRGMVSLTHRSADCNCPPDTFDAQSPGSADADGERCRPCPEGVECKGHGAHPLIAEGYFSDRDLDLQVGVWKCFQGGNMCRGGPPGYACAPGREGLVCAQCQEGMKEGKDGACVPCTENSPLVEAIFAMVCLGCLLMVVLAYLAIDRYGKGSQSHSTLMCALVFSMAVTMMQQLGIMALFTEVRWPEPVRSLLHAVSLLTFDIDILQLNCLTNMSALSRFAGKVGVMAVFSVVLLLVHVFVVTLCHRGRFGERNSSLVGSVGTIFLVFFISVVSTVLSPLQCVKHPNGKWSVSSALDVMCWEEGDHSAMIAIGLVALLAPLVFLAWCCVCVHRFPMMMLRGRTDFLQMHRFLFFRYTPEAYWYSLVHIARSLVIANLPTIPNVAAQLLGMQAVLVSQIVVITKFEPWRVPLTNKLDLVFNAAVLFVVSCGSYYVEAVPDSMMAWLAVIVLLFPLALLPATAAFAVYRSFIKGKNTYQYFICHHKAGAGALARLLKMMLLGTKGVSGKVFVDCDDLTDLGTLFDTVGHDLDNLVVVCSKDLFTRLWCVGEVTTTMMKGVGAIRLALPDFKEPDDDFVNDFEAIVGDLSVLASRGLAVEDVRRALMWSNGLKTIQVDKVNPEFLEGVAASIVQNSDSVQAVAADAAAPAYVEGKTTIILHDESNIEATASALVLIRMLASLFAHTPDLMPVMASADQKLPSGADKAILICSPGALEQETLLRSVCSALSSGAVFLPVVVNDGFRFPAATFNSDHTDLAMKALDASRKEASAMMSEVAHIFQAIAVNFPANMAGELVLSLRANELAGRVRKLESGVVGTGTFGGRSDKKMGMEASSARQADAHKSDNMQSLDLDGVYNDEAE